MITGVGDRDGTRLRPVGFMPFCFALILYKSLFSKYQLHFHANLRSLDSVLADIMHIGFKYGLVGPY